MKVKAILFDHDGTLVNSELAHFEMWSEVLYKFDIELSHHDYKNYYAGIPVTENARIIVDKYSLNIEPAELVLAKSELTNRYLSRQAFPLMNGALESVHYLYEQGLKIGIVTGAGKEGVKTTLKNHKLDRFVSIVVSGDDVKISKPAPDCYLLASEKLGLQPSDCIAIEDTYSGSISAIQANIKCIGVSSTSGGRDLFTGTIYTCNNLNMAIKWISQNCQLQSN